jgi:hypothetical protein
MDIFGDVFFCTNCGDPIQHPNHGVSETEIVAYPEGLRELIVTLDGRQIHACSFVAAPVDPEWPDSASGLSGSPETPTMDRARRHRDVGR